MFGVWEVLGLWERLASVAIFVQFCSAGRKQAPVPARPYSSFLCPVPTMRLAYGLCTHKHTSPEAVGPP